MKAEGLETSTNWNPKRLNTCDTKTLYFYFVAVQQERKPHSPEKALSQQHIATSSQRVYIRKDLADSSVATKAFDYVS